MDGVGLVSYPTILFHKVDRRVSMGNIVFARLTGHDADMDTIDLGNLSTTGEETILLDLDSCKPEELTGHRIYVPAILINSIQGENVKVYHELQQYTFFDSVKEVILQDRERKGIFRLRREINGQKNNLVIASDLCALASIFGTMEKVVVRHSRLGLEPKHIIVMVRYSAGTMAHIDYTFSDKESLALEWSGTRRIIEFNSEEMNPVVPSRYLKATVQVHIVPIIRSAKDFVSVREELTSVLAFLGGEET
jgi:hypothetical protein